MAAPGQAAARGRGVARARGSASARSPRAGGCHIGGYGGRGLQGVPLPRASRWVLDDDR
jgi:hypothetical protein